MTDKILEMKSSGMSYSKIGEAVGKCPSWVQQYIKDRSGNLAIDKPCQKCGSTDRLVNHHYDYSLDNVIVLCRKCHARVHTMKRNEFFIGYENLPNGQRFKTSRRKHGN